MVWGIKAQNKVAEIHTHKPRRAGEATHCGPLVEKWWFESLELRKALGWVWSAPARAVFRISRLSIASYSPDYKVTPSHILIRFSGKHEFLSSVTFIFLYPAAPWVLSVVPDSVERAQHFQTRGFISTADPWAGIIYRHGTLYRVRVYNRNNTLCYNQQPELLLSVFNGSSGISAHIVYLKWLHGVLNWLLNSLSVIAMPLTRPSARRLATLAVSIL